VYKGSYNRCVKNGLKKISENRLWWA